MSQIGGTGENNVKLGIGTQRLKNAVDHDIGSVVPAEEVDGDPGEAPLGSRHAVRENKPTGDTALA